MDGPLRPHYKARESGPGGKHPSRPPSLPSEPAIFPPPEPAPQASTLPEALFPPPKPAPFPKHPSRPPSQQFAEVVVGRSVQEDSDDEEGQDKQQQVESVPSQQQGQQDRVKWCCKHCQRVLSGKNEDRMKKHLLNPRACKFLDSSAAADCTAKEIAQPAREKTDHTVHCTVSYRIYGANFQKYGKNRSYRTVPYYRTPYRTPYCNSPDRNM